jgi:hypothetical protein
MMVVVTAAAVAVAVVREAFYNGFTNFQSNKSLVLKLYNIFPEITFQETEKQLKIADNFNVF